MKENCLLLSFLLLNFDCAGGGGALKINTKNCGLSNFISKLTLNFQYHPLINSQHENFNYNYKKRKYVFLQILLQNRFFITFYRIALFNLRNYLYFALKHELDKEYILTSWIYIQINYVVVSYYIIYFFKAKNICYFSSEIAYKR